MKRIAIIGAGMLGLQIAHHIQNDQGYIIAGFFDDNNMNIRPNDYGPILGKVSDVKTFYKKGAFDQVIIGIGYMHLQYRWQCFEQLKNDVPFLTFIHSSVVIDKSSNIGSGSFIMARSIIDDHVSIGRNVFLQIGCSISHHSSIEDNCFLGPNVTIAGRVKVEQNCFLGVGTILIDTIDIASGVQTGGGAVVTDSIHEPGLYVGVPAKKIR